MPTDRRTAAATFVASSMPASLAMQAITLSS